MNTCTVTENLRIVKGDKSDYESLSHYHYREPNLRPYAAIFAMKGGFRTAERIETVGVIVYSMPTVGAQMRNAATGGLFVGLDKSTRLKLINKNIRTISRVIIEPRFRSLGLAVRLVKETMPLMNVPFIEALAVMGGINPFFEKAGMTKYEPPMSTTCVRLIEALSAAGIEQQDLIDPQIVQKKLDALSSDGSDVSDRSDESRFIEREMARFLQSFGQRRLMQPGIDRTRFTLSKLTDRPVYYLWKNPNLQLIIDD
jgi:hypothetical protein